MSYSIRPDDRRVTSVSVSPDGYVSHVWGGDDEWPSQSASDVILDLELGGARYFVQWPDGAAQILCTEDAGGRYLSCERNGTSSNALLSLPRHGRAEDDVA